MIFALQSSLAPPWARTTAPSSWIGTARNRTLQQVRPCLRPGRCRNTLSRRATRRERFRRQSPGGVGGRILLANRADFLRCVRPDVVTVACFNALGRPSSTLLTSSSCLSCTSHGLAAVDCGLTEYSSPPPSPTSCSEWYRSFFAAGFTRDLEGRAGRVAVPCREIAARGKRSRGVSCPRKSSARH